MDQATTVLRDGASNRGTAFDAEQRRALRLTGRLHADFDRIVAPKTMVGTVPS